MTNEKQIRLFCRLTVRLLYDSIDEECQKRTLSTPVARPKNKERKVIPMHTKYVKLKPMGIVKV